MTKHSYEKRYSYSVRRDGEKVGVSLYTDDLDEIRRADAEPGQYVAFVWVGYADYRYHEGGTEVIRRDTRKLSRAEWAQ